MEEENIIKCYHCGDTIHWSHNVICGGKCRWCWMCAETQHINDDEKAVEGHHPTCTYDSDIDDIFN